MPVPEVAIYGLGRFGRALAGALESIGRKPRVGGRAGGPEGLLRGLKPGALVVLSVRDDAIAEVAQAFAALPECRFHSFVHCSGAHGPGLLQPLAQAGAAIGAFHRLQSFPPDNAAARVPGSWCAIAGLKPLRESLRSLAKALQMHPFELPDEARPAYHAAAVLASNALVALLAAGRELLRSQPIAHEATANMLLPLVRGTLDNVAEIGPEKALTGPVARGDVETLKTHLRALPPTIKPLYRALMLETVALAERAGRITTAQAGKLRKALG
jgi:predicted short-subunit dehydrogenase-like oxidoreductase (DUF2520 family)